MCSQQVPPYIVSQNAAAAAAFGGQYGLQTVGAGGAGSTMPTMLSTVDATSAAAAAAAAGSVATPTSQVLSATGTKLTRPDRLEVSSRRGAGEEGDVGDGNKIYGRWIYI